MPTGPEQTFREVEMFGPGVGTARDRGRAEPDERRRIRHRAYHRTLGDERLDTRQRQARGDRQHQRVRAERRQRRLEGRGDVAGLHRDDDDVGVGDGPRRARHDADLRELLLERDPAFAVDLRDRERRRLPSRRRAGRRREPRPSSRRRAAQRVTSSARVTAVVRGAMHDRARRQPRRRLVRRTSSGPRNLRIRPRTSPNGADPPAPRARRQTHGSTRAIRNTRLLQTFLDDLSSWRSRAGSRAGTSVRPARRARR